MCLLLSRMGRGRGRGRRQRGFDDDNGFEAWGGYMAAKKAKLEEQFLRDQGTIFFVVVLVKSNNFFQKGKLNRFCKTEFSMVWRCLSMVILTPQPTKLNES